MDFALFKHLSQLIYNMSVMVAPMVIGCLFQETCIIKYYCDPSVVVREYLGVVYSVLTRKLVIWVLTTTLHTFSNCIDFTPQDLPNHP